MSNFYGFIDIISTNVSKAPLVSGYLRAYYATGTDGIEATAKQIAAAKAAGMAVVLIDQTPSLSVFAAGIADVADIEKGAGTQASLITAVKQRQAHGWQSTVYCSYSNLAGLEAALKAAGCDMSLVWFGVADYSWSVSQAESLLNQNSRWAYCQYGDNVSNANTLVPGTNVTCGAADCDIDVACEAWASQFLKIPAPPAPKPKPVAEPELKSGSTGTAVMLAQTLLNKRPIKPNLTVDGDFGALTEAAVKKVQTNNHLSVDGVIGPKTWAILGNYS